MGLDKVSTKEVENGCHRGLIVLFLLDREWEQ